MPDDSPPGCRLGSISEVKAGPLLLVVALLRRKAEVRSHLLLGLVSFLVHSSEAPPIQGPLGWAAS